MVPVHGTSSTMVKTPAQQLQRRQHDNGNGAIMTMATKTKAR
jgi:hypothetical protein